MQPHVRNGLSFLGVCVLAGLALAFILIPKQTDPAREIADKDSPTYYPRGTRVAETASPIDDLGDSVSPASANASSETPLQLMLVANDRQQLANGSELLVVSGRVTNPGEKAELIPPIRAVLKNAITGEVIYEWTIDPPSPSLAGGMAVSFNSEEVDIPPGGDSLSLSFADGHSL